MTVTNCTITGYLAVPQSDWADNGADSDMAPLTGTVSLRPVTVDRKPLAVAPDYDPPAVFAQPVMAFTGVVEDGVLKTVKGGDPGLRVPANDPVLGLDQIWYRIDFDLATGAGQKVVIEPQYFEAPSADTSVDLSNILTETGSTVSGVVRQAGYAEDIIDSGATGRDVVRSSTQLQARSALNGERKTTFNVLDYIASPADTSSHNAGFQAAINAATDAGGGEVVVPPGDWHISGLTVPREKPLTIRGVVEIFPSNFGGTTFRGSRLRRTGTQPILSMIGGTSVVPEEGEGGVSNGAWLNLSQYVRNVTVQDISLYDGNQSATTPLVEMKGAKFCHFNRVVVWRAWSGAALLDMIGTEDCRFFSSYFLGGGNQATGLAAVEIRGASSDYADCNALTFVSCTVENYFGPGVRIGDDTSTAAFNPSLIMFVNHKQESQSTTGPHFVIGRANSILFRNAYISHWNTSGPIIDIRKSFGVYGDVGFAQIYRDGYVDPSCRVNVSANATLISLDVNVFAGPGSTVNVVTQANVDENVDIRISGVSHRINGATRAIGWVKTGTVFQATDAGTACQYVFKRGTLNTWAVGNPSNPSGDQQQFEIIATDPAGNSQSVMRLRSFTHTSGTNPATATYRDLSLSAYLSLPSGSLGWVNFRTQTADPVSPVGGHQVYTKDNGGGRSQLAVYDSTAAGASWIETRGVASTASTTSLTVNSDKVNHQTVSALASDLTVNAPTGTPTSGQRLILAIKDNGTARALTWNAAWAPVKLNLPTTTVAGEWLVVRAEWNAAAAAWLVTEIQGGAATIPQSAVATLTSDLAARELTANKGQANGYASLDSGGKVPAAQLPASVMEYLGLWDASTNTPTLANGTGNAGDTYRVSVAGTRNLGGGSVAYEVGDLVIYDGSSWQRSDSTDAVTTVNGYTGTVTLTKSDVGLGSVDNTADAIKAVAQAAILSTARTVRTDLASASSASFDGSANITPGVTGTLPVANGGTGATTLTGLVKGAGTSAFSAATAGTDYLNTDDLGIDLDAGENTFPRRMLSNAISVSMTNSTMRLSYFTARRTETVNSVRLCAATGQSGGTLVRVGVYEVAANGDLTLVASTANDTALLSANSTFYTKALSASFTKTRAKRYAVGVLMVGTSNSPTVFGVNGLTAEMGENPRLTGLISGQSDLPASAVAGAVANASGLIYTALVP